MATTSGVGSTSGVPDWLTNSNAKPAQTSNVDDLTNRNTFLQLLVAQIRNQNPLNPQDGIQFISQLAQFSDLEQTMQMRQELTSIRTALDSYIAAKSGGTGTNTDNSTDSSTQKG
jgi:flagellar basal-body rod modification protein FlgD